MTEHVVVSMKSINQGRGWKAYHDAIYDGDTFHALCGADKRMDIPVVVRYDDIEGYWKGYNHCSHCSKKRATDDT